MTYVDLLSSIFLAAMLILVWLNYDLHRRRGKSYGYLTIVPIVFSTFFALSIVERLDWQRYSRGFAFLAVLNFLVILLWVRRDLETVKAGRRLDRRSD